MTPDFPSRSLLFLLLPSCLYVALLTAVTLLNHAGPERFWFGALNLYLPQAMWLLPGIIIFIWYLRVAPRLVWVPLLCLIYVAGPLMGFCWGRREPGVPGAQRLRVMTCNIKYGKRDVGYLIEEIGRQKPDLVLFQDADLSTKGPLGDYLAHWQVRAEGQYVIASRYPLSEAEVFRTSVDERKHSSMRCQLLLGDTTLTVYNLHLQTPRHGLNAFRRMKKRPHFFPMAVERFEGNVQARLGQAEAVRNMVIREDGPVLLAGDFNAPEPSIVCTMMREAGLHDAFDEGGRGYGYTYGHLLLQHRVPWILQSWMRIDHIMLGYGLRARRCWTGTDIASEHRPVIADIEVPRR